MIGDLAFGEPFGCLESSEYHPWVKMIFAMACVGTVLQTVAHYPLLKNLLLSMVPKSEVAKREGHLALTKEKLLRRMQADKERPDLIGGLLKKRREWNLSLETLQANNAHSYHWWLGDDSYSSLWSIPSRNGSSCAPEIG